MAGLILEIQTRHEHRYIPLDKPLIRVGRALDNDIILSDPTVSPHHFVIKRSAHQGYVLHPLSDENGIHVGREKLLQPLALSDEVRTFIAGRTRLRVLPRDHPVERTRPLNCPHGTGCLFGSWLPAWGLLIVFLAVSAVDNFLATPEHLNWESFGRDQTVIVLVVLAITSGLTLLVRLTAQRWEPASALSFVCLMLLLATVFDQATVFLDYFFSTSVFGFFADLGWSFLVAPAALLWFMIRINHGSTASSMIITLALLTPAAYFQSQQVITHYGLFDTFGKNAYYPSELYPFDIRRQETLPVDQYISDMEKRFAGE